MTPITTITPHPVTLPAAIDPLMKLPEVLASVRISRSRLYQLAKQGDFPRPVKLGQRASAWRASDVARWIAERAPAAA